MVVSFVPAVRPFLILFVLATGFACGTNTDPMDASGPDAPTIDADGASPAGDSSPRADAGAPTDADAGIGRRRSNGCAERSAAIAAIAGNVISVSPLPDGQVMTDGATRTLRQVISSAEPGDIILLNDGTYSIPEADGGSYTGLYFTTPNVTLRSASGDPTRVILDSAYADHGGSTAAITIAASGVVLAGFTVQRSIFHLIHLWAAADDVVIHDVHLVDGGQQFLKASPGGGETIDSVEVSCSQFRMTAAGRDNVWGYGPSRGGTTCYTGGIDTHGARDWVVHDSLFEGIYCNAGGVPRPAHGRKGDERDDQTYTGGLSEHAIHMWDSESGSGHVIERNHIIDCARGIGLGMRDEVYGTVIRNNMIFSRHAGSREHDVGIGIERAHDTQVYNNTVYFSSPDAYSNAIEYRWASTSGLDIRNNLTNRRLRARNSADATLGSNVSDAESGWFVDAVSGDLHLSSCDEARVVGAGEPLSAVAIDIDGEPRGATNDIGADECSPD